MDRFCAMGQITLNFPYYHQMQFYPENSFLTTIAPPPVSIWPAEYPRLVFSTLKNISKLKRRWLLVCSKASYWTKYHLRPDATWAPIAVTYLYTSPICLHTFSTFVWTVDFERSSWTNEFEPEQFDTDFLSWIGQRIPKWTWRHRAGRGSLSHITKFFIFT